jgi:hypothetical protein
VFTYGSRIITYHSNFVLGGRSTRGIKLQTFLNLLLKSFSELGRWSLRKVVNSRGNRALVGKETRDSALVLGSCATNERRMVQKTVLGCVSLGLESPEQGLLCTKNLNSRSRVLGQVGQATGVRNKTSTNNLSNQSSQVRSDNAHLGYEV